MHIDIKSLNAFIVGSTNLVFHIIFFPFKMHVCRLFTKGPVHVR